MGSSAHPGSEEPVLVASEAATTDALDRIAVIGRPDARATRPSPLRTPATAPSIDPMTTTSQTSNVARAHADAETSLTVLEGTLSQIAADSAVAADRLHEAGATTSPAPQTQAATWWLQRVAASALAPRATCR